MEPITCAACNSGILDTGAAHASCCALGEATRGHNAVSSLIHAAAQQCDHTSEMEVPGLIPGMDLRYSPRPWAMPTLHWMSPSAPRTPPRLVLTATSPGSRPNLSIMAPTWPPFFAKISLTSPIVWSAYGRPHPDTLAVLRSLSKSIARKRNIASAEVVFHRLHSSITP